MADSEDSAISSIYSVGTDTVLNQQIPGEEEVWNKYFSLMEESRQIHKSCIAEGRDRFGWWVGPDGNDFNNTYQPVFIYSQPIEEFEDIDWSVQGEPRNGKLLIHKYIGLSPIGPISICFKKRIVDANGATHPDYSGPGGSKELDYDDIEGGEKGTFLYLLNQDRGAETFVATQQRIVDPNIKLGLVRTQGGSLNLVLGTTFEQGVYREGNGESNRWWLSKDVDIEEVTNAIDLSNKNSLKPKEHTSEQKRLDTLNTNANLIASQLRTSAD